MQSKDMATKIRSDKEDLIEKNINFNYIQVRTITSPIYYIELNRRTLYKYTNHKTFFKQKLTTSCFCRLNRRRPKP